MNQHIQNKAIHRRNYKIPVLFLLFVLAMGIFLFSILKTITSERRIPSHNKTIHDRSFRGAIISADNYTLSSSNKTYQAVIRGASIKPEMKETFVRLFSIYANIPEEEILKKFKRKGKPIQSNIILSKTIGSSTAMQLKSLAIKLRRLGVFRSIKTRSGIDVLFGLDIIENGETRRFPLKDVMSPILGYVSKESDGRYTRPKGQKGLERNYNEHITSKKDGYFKGKRDVLGAVIHDKNSINSGRVDGLNLHLNIPLALQRRVELMIDAMKQKIDADEILVGVMESGTGKVLALASTERYDPTHILQEDVLKLSPKFAEYPHEAGSVLKPLVIAIALDQKKITPNTSFQTGYKNFDITGGQTINDDHFHSSLKAADIIVYSSNIGTSKISWTLTGKEFRDGLLKFGVAKKSGIDLSRDLPGSLKPQHILEHKMHRANSSFGYGMLLTFAQLFKAYSAFNNDGIAVTPRIVNYLADGKGKQYKLKPRVGDIKAVGKKAANQIHDILLEVVKRGTGRATRYPGLAVGGKTGTAHIAKNGSYVSEYHSSFYGFANDKHGNKYTIGVLVIRAKKWKKYYASQSAVPTFKNILKILVAQKHLKPDPKEMVQEKIDETLYVADIPKKEKNHKVEERKIEKKKMHPKKKKIVEKKKKKTKKRKKKKTVKSLFNIKDKPHKKTKRQKNKTKLKIEVHSKPKPATKKLPNDLFKDLDMF